MRRGLFSLVPSAALATTALALGLTDNWARVGVPLGDANFGDLSVIFFAAQCASADPAWTAASEPCQPGMSHYNYPSVWATTFGLMGADPTWTPVMAAILMGLFIISLAPLTWIALGGTRHISTVVVVTLASMSPPVWLAFQRGNIDLFIFFLITLALGVWVFRATKTAAVLIGFATLLKVFPIGAAVMLFSRQRPRRGALVTLAVVVGLAVAITFKDLRVIAERTPQIDGASFGTGLLPLLLSNQFDLGWSITITRGLGLLAFAIGFGLILAFVRRCDYAAPWTRLVNVTSSDPVSTAAVLAGSGVFLVSYILGPSYDYRLLFLIPIIAGLLRTGTALAMASAVILTVQLFLSYSTFVGPAEYLSDLMLLILAPLIALGAIQILRRAHS